jgi:flagellar hook-length control protein FliK
MTTDRTAASARPTAPERPVLGRPSAPPADAFSALLGAVAPRADEAPRSEPRRDDAARREAAPRPAAEDAPATPAPADAPATTEPATDAPSRLVIPEIFALQLAGPMPPIVPAVAPAAEAATAAPVLPVLTATLPTLPTPAPALTPPVTAEVALPDAETAAPAPAPALPLLSGLTAASTVAADAVTEPTLPAVQPQAPAPAPAEAPAEPAQTTLPSLSTGSQQTPSDAQPQEQPATAAPAPAAKPAEAPAAPAAPQPVATAAPAAPVATPAPTGLERAVPLYRAVETTATLLHVAAERGVTHARLNLKPAELGGIEVRLQSTPHGVAAQLVAESPEAARMLVQASEDLRRQLSERDVTLLSLDVSTQSDQRHQAAAGGGADGFGEQFRSGSQSASSRTHHGESADQVPAPAETTLVLPGGVLVDVLA